MRFELTYGHHMTTVIIKFIYIFFRGVVISGCEGHLEAQYMTNYHLFNPKKKSIYKMAVYKFFAIYKFLKHPFRGS